MIWVTWRQQRTELLIAAAVLALIAALLVPTGLNMASAYHQSGLSACPGPNTSDTCGQAIEAFVSRFEPLRNGLALLTLVSGLIGVLLAAPFVLELEHGTHRLAWTQSITRRRWIASKLSITIAAALVAALVLTLLMTWWHTPLGHIDGRMESSVYDSEGSVTFGYTLFALGLALAVGAIWRRTVPAVTVGFVGYLAMRIFVDNWLRQRLITPHSATWSPSGSRGPDLDHALVISQGPSDRLGHIVSGISPCVHQVSSSVKAISGECLAQHGAGYVHAVYQPASRFWTLQGIETSLFGGIGLALILLAAWWTHKRVA